MQSCCRFILKETASPKNKGKLLEIIKYKYFCKMPYLRSHPTVGSSFSSHHTRLSLNSSNAEISDLNYLLQQSSRHSVQAEHLSTDKRSTTKSLEEPVIYNKSCTESSNCPSREAGFLHCCGANPGNA